MRVSRPGRQRTSAVRAVALIAFASAACTSSPSETPPEPPDVAGAIFAVSTVETAPLVRFDMPSLELTPSGTVPSDPAASSASVAASGDIVVGLISRGGAARVFHVGRAGSTEQIGPTLRVASDERPSIVVVAGTAVVADCSAVRVLDIAQPSGWRRVGTGCSSGLSADGASVVFSPDGRSVVSCVLPCERPREIVDADAIASTIPDAEPWRIFGPIAWSEVGVAFTAKSGERVGFFVADPNGQVETVAREEPQDRSSTPVLAWDPTGALLAIVDNLGTGGTLRLFDPSTGAQRVIALDPLAFDGLAWSPDGTALGTITSADAFLVVGTDERWRLRVETTWSELLAWVE